MGCSMPVVKIFLRHRAALNFSLEFFNPSSFVLVVLVVQGISILAPTYIPSSLFFFLFLLK